MDYIAKVESEYQIYKDKILYKIRLIRKKDNERVFSFRTYDVDEICNLEDREKGLKFTFKISTLKLKEETNGWINFNFEVPIRTREAQDIWGVNYGTITISNNTSGTLV